MSTESTVTRINENDSSSATSTANVTNDSLSASAASVLSNKSTSSSLATNKSEATSTNSNSASSKQKFSALNINNLYKGKSLENPKASVVVHKHGLQTVGKVGAGRRVPPPANIPSLKSSSSAGNLINNSNINSTSTSISSSNSLTLPSSSTNNSVTGVNIVPTGGQGWVAASGKDDSDSLINNNNKPSENISTCPSITDSISTTLSASNDFFAPTMTNSNTSCSSNERNGSIHGPITQQQQSNNSTIPIHKDRRQTDPYFAQEFPQLLSATGGGNAVAGNSQQQQSQSAKDQVSPGSRVAGTGYEIGGPGRNNHNQSYQHYKDQGGGPEEEVNLIATNTTLLDGPPASMDPQFSATNRLSNSRNNIKSSTSISSNPNFLLPDPPQLSLNSSTNASNTTINQQQRNYQQQFSSSSQYERNSSNHHYRSKTQKEKKFMPVIISETELKSLDKILNQDGECSWAMEAEIDYHAKLDFSDSSSDDDEEPKSKSSGSNNSATNTTSTTTTATTKPVIEKPNSEASKVQSTSSSNPAPVPKDLSSKTKDESSESRSGSVELSSSVPFRQPAQPPLQHDSYRTSYLGRKSDSIYEFNRKDQEFESRRESERYYRESHRSQQLPRGGGNQRETYSNNSAPYQPPPPPSNQVSGQSSSTSRQVDRERGTGGNSGTNRRGNHDEIWRPKRPQDEIASAVMRGRQMRDTDDDIDEPPTSTKKQIDPTSSSGGNGPSDELIPSTTSQSTKDKRGGNDEMRLYERRRDDGFAVRLSDRNERDRYTSSKNSYATNLPPRLQRQAEMQQYREQGSRSNRGQQIDSRYDDSRMLRNQSDRPIGDDLYDPRPRGDRRTPEESSSLRSNQVRSDAGSWRNLKRNDKTNERRDSQIESNRNTLTPPSQQSLDSKPTEDVQVQSRKTSNDSSSSKLTNESPEVEMVNRKSSTTTEPVTANDPVPNKCPEESAGIKKQDDRSESVDVDGNCLPSRRSIDMERPQRSNTNQSKSSTTENRNYDPSKPSDRGGVRNQPHVSRPDVSSSNNRSNGPKQQLSHSDSREFHRSGDSSRQPQQQQQQLNRKDSYRSGSNNVPSTQQPLPMQPPSVQSQQQQQPKTALLPTPGTDEPKKIAFTPSPESVESRHTPPQPDKAATPPVINPIGTTGQPGIPSQHVYPISAPIIRSVVRTAYGPPASGKAAFSGTESVVANKQQSPPAQSITPPVRSGGDNPKSSGEIKSQPNPKRDVNPRETRSGGRRGEPKDSIRRHESGRSVRHERDRKISTSSRSSNNASSAPNNSTTVNNQGDLDDEWETASDMSDNVEVRDYSSSTNRPSNTGKTMSGSNSSEQRQGPKSGQTMVRVGQERQNQAPPPRDDLRGRGRRGGGRDDRREQTSETTNYRGSNRSSMVPPSQTGYSRNERGRTESRNDGRGRTGSFRNAPPPPMSGSGSSKTNQSSQQSIRGANSDGIVNAMSKISLDDSKKQTPPRNNSSTNPSNNVEEDGGDLDIYNGNKGRRGRSSSNVSNSMGNKPSTRRKERSKSKGRARGNREPRPHETSQTTTQSQRSYSQQQQPSTTSTVVDSKGAENRQERPNESKPKSDLKPNQSNQQQTVSRTFQQASNTKQVPVSNQQKSATTASTQQTGPSSHPSTSSTKSNSFEQHDSGVESGDQPPSTSSTCTSQRSSPGNEENRVVTSTATISSKLATSTNSSSNVKCSTTTTSTINNEKNKPKSSADVKLTNSNTNKISDLIVGTLIYENTKLKEANKVLSKIEEGVDPTTTSTAAKVAASVPSVPHPSSSVAEELSLKFASVKKVWDNPPPPTSQPTVSESSTERKNSLLSLNSPVEKNQQQQANFNKPQQTIGAFNSVLQVPQRPLSYHCPPPIPLSFPNGNYFGILSGQMSTSPPSIAMNSDGHRTNYQQAQSAQPSYGQTQQTVNFHQNSLVQTPTSPPTQLYSNPLAATAVANPVGNSGSFGQPFGQMDATINAFNAHQNPSQMHSVIPHQHFMPTVQPASQQNVAAAFNQHVAAMNPAAAALIANQNQASLFMAQLAHQQSQHGMDPQMMSKFSLAAAVNQNNVMAANNMLKSQGGYGQPNQQVGANAHGQPSLHQGSMNQMTSAQQGTANWAANQAAAVAQTQSYGAAQLAGHYVSNQSGPTQSNSGFNRQPSRNQIDPTQQQSALRSFFQANMMNVDALQMNHHAAQYAALNHIGHGGHHDAGRQQQAALAMQQAAAVSRHQGQAAAAAAQFAAAQQPNALNQNWPTHMQQQQKFIIPTIPNRHILQMFAGNAAVAQQHPVSMVPSGQVPIGMAPGVSNNHRTSPSGSISLGGSATIPAPIQRPNNNGPKNGSSNIGNNSQYSRNNNGNKFNDQSRSGGNGNNGKGRNYYNHNNNNRNSTTPSPSSKSVVSVSEMNGTTTPVIVNNNNNPVPTTVVDSATNN
ncbi:hypothetical protein RDWZM_002264 [Blomia tropicalis]|uniref:BAT2 N-terminal domain-containing protein n=1 Tax=Blomia tropicalis TaxID=40697 RepID=A0A9Q0RRE0_BLOTA|nr:hypothetical protein RDWZM_002264 [Blomia tropicalis]